jgi:hypothetical protein
VDPVTGTDEDSLTDLPPLDGGDEDEAVPEVEDFEGDDVKSGEGDLDDTTGELDPAEFLPDSLDASTGNAMADAEESRDLDVGGIDPLGDESESLLTDNDEPGTEGELLDIDEQEEGVRDAGEEGPTHEDDGQSLGDLPPMDADEEGSLEDEAFFDGIADEIAAPWADDAWEKIAEHRDSATSAELERLGLAGLVAVPPPDPAKLTAGMAGMASVCAVAELPGYLACARAKPGQDASIVFLHTEETGARTIAELGNPDAHEITRLVYDAATGVLWVVGEFGLVGLRKPQR